VIRIIPERESAQLLVRKSLRFEGAETVVRPIIEDVRMHGDEALVRYARDLDGFDRESFAIPQSKIEEAAANLSASLREAIEAASKNIRAFAELQKPKRWCDEIARGLRVGQIVRPLETVCCYIPAGRYPLISTVLMTVIPAQVAGVPDICLTTPKPSPEILGAAGVLGISRVFLLGGAHAIAAFAFGTETVPRADRIVGPGSIYVTAAKKLLAGEVAIDFIAGPTEIVIIANEGDATWIAADMLAQAEHDADACAILLTTSASLARAVSAQIETQLGTLGTAPVARDAIEKNSAIILVESSARAIEWSNHFAPEHLSLHDPALLEGVLHAGSVFIGPMSTEAAGDYASGPNHVLPTSGVARIRGGLSVADFVKVISTQELSADALENLAPAITTLARAEGLEAHARSVGVRCSGGALSPFHATLAVTRLNGDRAPSLQPREAVRRMAAYNPPTAGRAEKLRLDFNENTVGCSPKVAELFRTRLSGEQLAIYPEYVETKARLATHFGVAENEMLLTNGTDEAIQILINTFVEANAEVIILQPSYAMYRFYAELGGAKIRLIDYRQGSLALPLEELLAAVSAETKAILISNPNNPTGTAAKLDGIEQILQRAPNAAVLIDEAYFEFCGITALPLLSEFPNLFISRTFSKAYGMAGMRLGCLFSDPRNLDFARKAQSPYSVNSLAALAGIAAVEDGEYVGRYVEEVLAAREILYAELERLGVPHYRSEGNFVLMQLGDRSGEICEQLRAAGVLVRDRSYELPGCARVTVGTREQVARFIQELARTWRPA